MPDKLVLDIEVNTDTKRLEEKLNSVFRKIEKSTKNLFSAISVKVGFDKRDMEATSREISRIISKTIGNSIKSVSSIGDGKSGGRITIGDVSKIIKESSNAFKEAQAFYKAAEELVNTDYKSAKEYSELAREMREYVKKVAMPRAVKKIELEGRSENVWMSGALASWFKKVDAISSDERFRDRVREAVKILLRSISNDRKIIDILTGKSDGISGNNRQMVLGEISKIIKENSNAFKEMWVFYKAAEELVNVDYDVAKKYSELAQEMREYVKKVAEPRAMRRIESEARGEDIWTSGTLASWFERVDTVSDGEQLGKIKGVMGSLAGRFGSLIKDIGGKGGEQLGKIKGVMGSLTEGFGSLIKGIGGKGGEIAGALVGGLGGIGGEIIGIISKGLGPLGIIMTGIKSGLDILKSINRSIGELGGPLSATLKILNLSFKLALKPIADILGMILMPIAVALLRMVIIPFYSIFIHAWREAIGEGKTPGTAEFGLALLKDFVVDLGKAIFDFIKGKLESISMTQVAKTSLAVAASPVFGMIEILKLLFGNINISASDILEWLFGGIVITGSDILRWLFGGIIITAKDILKWLFGWGGSKSSSKNDGTVSSGMGKFVGAVVSAGETVVHGAKSIGRAVAIAVKNVIYDVGKSLKRLNEAFIVLGGGGKFLMEHKNIRAYQIGGYVEKTGLAVVHRGEVVIPAWHAKKFNFTNIRDTPPISVSINVNVDKVSSDIDIRRMADEIGEIILRKIRYGSGIW